MVREQLFIKCSGNAEDTDLDAIGQKLFTVIQNSDFTYRTSIQREDLDLGFSLGVE